VSGLNAGQRLIKRMFDFILAALGLLITGWVIFIAWLCASIDTRSNGMFTQARVGKNGRQFTILKIKTMRPIEWVDTDVTTVDDPRITPLGRLFRAAKIDELPQLLNVLVGSMSFVGPRPDVPGYADQLAGGDRLLLTVRPGITGPATLKYRDEADLLAQQDDPERYNREIIYPDKVEINKAYILNWTLAQDIAYIIRTVFPS
jgi:lipopolysaccharide/colanic/teichoic acid biosynthesis glycosyltransferase